MRKGLIVGGVVLVLITVVLFVFYPDDVEDAGTLFIYSEDPENTSLMVMSYPPLNNESVIEFGREVFEVLGRDIEIYDEISSFKEASGLWMFFFGHKQVADGGGAVVINETARIYRIWFEG